MHLADVERAAARRTLARQAAIRHNDGEPVQPGDRSMTTPDPDRAPADPTDESDTEGHQFLTEDLARTRQQDRARDIDRATRDARTRGSEHRRGLLDRLRGR
jgi:hypothetical protein